MRAVARGRAEEEPVRWTQESLFGDDVLDITIRVGVVVSGDHAQVQMERRQAGTGNLVAMWSIPHRPLAKIPLMVEELADELAAWIQPFP